MTASPRRAPAPSPPRRERGPSPVPLACFQLEGRLCRILPNGKAVPQEAVLGRLQLDGRRFLVVVADKARPSPTARLTRREREIALLVAEGLLTKQIAHRLGLSPHTVGAYVNRIYARLGCHNRAEMVALLLGLAPAEASAGEAQIPR